MQVTTERETCYSSEIVPPSVVERNRITATTFPILVLTFLARWSIPSDVRLLDRGQSEVSQSRRCCAFIGRRAERCNDRIKSTMAERERERETPAVIVLLIYESDKELTRKTRERSCVFFLFFFSRQKLCPPPPPPLNPSSLQWVGNSWKMLISDNRLCVFALLIYLAEVEVTVDHCHYHIYIPIHVLGRSECTQRDRKAKNICLLFFLR